MTNHRQHEDRQPGDQQHSEDPGEQPNIPPRTVHKTGRLLSGADRQAAQDRQEWQERFARAARDAREAQDARDAREMQAAWEAQQRETRLARQFAASIRQRAQDRYRKVWAAMDTGPLIDVIWPRPTPLPTPRTRPTGSLGDPEVLLMTRAASAGEPQPRFRVGERVYYSVAHTTQRNTIGGQLSGQTTTTTFLARVEGWRRWSTGYKYTVRASVERRDPQLGRVPDWAPTTTEVWEDYLTSDEARVRPLSGDPRPRRRRRTMPLLPPPSTPSTP